MANEQRIPGPSLAAILIAAVALCAATATARWAWVLLDEQIALREELNALKNRQAQVETQYEFWLRDLERERANHQE